MAYNPTIWTNREVEKPRTFTIIDNPDGTKTLVPAEGLVSEPGTPIMAVNMNNIENQLVAQDAGLADLTTKVGVVANAVSSSNTVQDPNTTEESLLLTSHANKPPGVALSNFFYIRTVFFGSRTSSKSQIATTYTGAPRIFIRSFYSGTWESWEELVTSKLPPRINVVLAAGWTNVLGEDLTYYKDAFGIVHVNGSLVKASGAGNTVTTLPVGYRPLKSRTFSYGQNYELYMNTNGIMSISGGDGRQSVDISFRTD